MNWLFKEEPANYNYDALARDGQTSWTGVRNPVAQRNLRSIKKGDRIFFYHTGNEKAVIGIRSYIKSGTTIRQSIVMGADFYDVDNATRGGPELGIGKNCVIDHAIIDKNARIGDGCVITPDGKPDNFDGANFYVRDGIVVVPKGASIPAGTWI